MKLGINNSTYYGTVEKDLFNTKFLFVIRFKYYRFPLDKL